MKVGGIVLAAGRSSRMGRPKALLEIEGETFLERAIAILAEGGCAPVVVVLATGAAAAPAREIATSSGAKAVANPAPDAEQIDSLRIGLAALSADLDAAVVFPVDHPLADAGTVRALVEAFASSGAPIVRPVYRDRPGHPVLFARATWAELANPTLERGARDVVHRHAGEVRDVRLDDRGVTVDVDTPGDYRREVDP